MEAVAETSLITAYCRALEHERPEACVRDRFARELAGARGRELLQRMSGPERVANGCIVRTYLLDRRILRWAGEHRAGMVINLGCGLDTRPYRLELPEPLRWVEIDHADVLAYKRTKLEPFAPTCRLEAVALDLRDTERLRCTFEHLMGSQESVLIVSEGLLTYWTAEAVAALARELQTWTQVEGWLTDLVSPAALRSMQTEIVSETGEHRAALCFAPERGSAFFERYGWTALCTESCVRESRLLNRSFVQDGVVQALLSAHQRDVLDSLYSVVELVRMEPTHSRKDRA